MQRREFIKMSSGMLLAPDFGGLAGSAASRVVIARKDLKRSKYGSISTDELAALFATGMQAFFGTVSADEGWRKIIRPGQTVGLKVNCLSGKGTTRPELVTVVTDSLRRAGIPAGQIIIWDRFNSDLEDAGFRIAYERNGIRCFGNDYLGFEEDFQISGSAASLVCKTLTRACDVVINLPVLKDHGIAGITGCMKNFFGAIHNPNKYHLNTGDPYIADVYNFTPVRSKVVLHICDALTAQYEGGPSYMPHWSWPCNSLILSRDPVALDHTGWQIIERERLRRGLPTLKEAGREPTYIYTAADAAHGLGFADPSKIELIKV